MTHGLMYSGAFETNFPNLKPGATTFVGSDGQEHDNQSWPAAVDGIRVWYMEKPGKHFVAVRVKDNTDDVVLPNPLLLEPSRHMGYGKRFSAEPTLVDDEIVTVLLTDMLTSNPELREKLRDIRNRIAAKK
jgi:hypothetical protein